MIGYEKRKRSLYLPEEHLSEMLHEAKRQDRSLSWIVQQAWLAARADIKRLPSIADALNITEKSSGLRMPQGARRDADSDPGQAD